MQRSHVRCMPSDAEPPVVRAGLKQLRLECEMVGSRPKAGTVGTALAAATVKRTAAARQSPNTPRGVSGPSIAPKKKIRSRFCPRWSVRLPLQLFCGHCPSDLAKCYLDPLIMLIVLVHPFLP